MLFKMLSFKYFKNLQNYKLIIFTNLKFRIAIFYFGIFKIKVH